MKSDYIIVSVKDPKDLYKGTIVIHDVRNAIEAFKVCEELFSVSPKIKRHLDFIEMNKQNSPLNDKEITRKARTILALILAFGFFLGVAAALIAT